MPRSVTTQQIASHCTNIDEMGLDPDGVHVIETATSTGRLTKLCKALVKTIRTDDPVPAWFELPEELFESLPMIDPRLGVDPGWEGQP